MNWYYVDGGQQAGPVSEAEFETLVRSGKIGPQTLVWKEGMANWQPCREAAPAVFQAAAPVAAGAGTTAAGTDPSAAGAAAGGMAGPAEPAGQALNCSQCGRPFPPSEVIRYGNRWVCAGCKPLFLQRLQEGASLGSANLAGTVPEAEILARDYEVDVGGSLTRAWEVFKANSGIMIGASALVYLAVIAANIVPYLSILLSLVLNGPLMGGLWVFYIRKIRGEDAGLPEAFSGFGPRFWQLVLAQLVPGLVSGAVFFGVAVLAVPAIFVSNRGSGGGSTVPTVAAVLVGIAVLIAAVVVIYLTVCWMFALPLVGDKGMKFWPALELSRKVVMKHWWMTFWLVVVSSILAMLGMLACGVGLLLTGPVAFGALAVHYERVFGDMAPEQG